MQTLVHKVGQYLPEAERAPGGLKFHCLEVRLITHIQACLLGTHLSLLALLQHAIIVSCVGDVKSHALAEC